MPYSDLPAAQAPGGRDDASGARQLADRAIRVLRAFTVSAVVVVAAERERTPTLLTITLPGRALHSAPASRADAEEPGAAPAGRWPRPGTWRSLRPGNWILPKASLRLDLLLPSAEADRQGPVN